MAALILHKYKYCRAPGQVEGPFSWSNSKTKIETSN